ncbi:MAG: tripartite tricarboxylate transporter substrate binding protein [Hyphomonadaceae bacterium]|nr:tripartite tricarboxylate transporter substrate binding protein [Hyphomonadaceae bacterium]
MRRTHTLPRIKATRPAAAMDRRNFCKAAAHAAIAFMLPLPARAQVYPDRPIKVVVPFAAGSASDIVARLVLEKMSTTLGQPFVFENQPGAGGNSGTMVIARAEPDGYRLLVSSSGPLAVNRTLTKNLSYDPQNDFEPISLLATLPNVVTVSTRLPVQSLADLTAYARAKPGVLNYSSVGPGSSQHLAGLLFQQITDTKMTHVPYRVTAQLISDLISGEVPLSFQLIPNIISQVQSGGMRALAVTAKTRSEALPDVPTTQEAGLPGYECAGWFALLAPRGTPKPIIDKLNNGAVSALRDPHLRKRLVDIGAEPTSSAPDELRTLISTEIVKWREVIAKAGLVPE